MRRYIERFDENLVSSGYVWQLGLSNLGLTLQL